MKYIALIRLENGKLSKEYTDLEPEKFFELHPQESEYLGSRIKSITHIPNIPNVKFKETKK